MNRKNVAVMIARPPVSASAVVPAHSSPPVAKRQVKMPYRIAVKTKNAAMISNSLASMCIERPNLLALGHFTATGFERVGGHRERRLGDRLQRLGVVLPGDPLLQVGLEVVGRHHPDLEVHHRVI